MPKGQKSTPEFRAQACRQVIEFSRPVREVSTDLGINLGTLRRWLREQRTEEALVAEAEEQDQDVEIGQLRAELKAAKDDQYWKDQEIEFLLNEEWVTVANTGAVSIDLEGWVIRDETTSNRFLIRDLELEPGSSVRFITGTGANGGGAYHLGESFPVWSNRGETVLLVDPDGLIAAHRFVPGG